MTKINENGIYEIKIKEAKNFDFCYKYKIITKDDRQFLNLIPMQDILKQDLIQLVKFIQDKSINGRMKNFLKDRKIPYNKALNIYELHRILMQKEEGAYYDYRSLAKKSLPM